MRRLSRLVTLTLALSAGVLHAQTSALVGTVMRDTLGHALGGGIEVRIPQLNGATATNYLGEFRFTRVPPGRYLVTIRALGFAPFSDSITFVANQAVNREFVLIPIATPLDPVTTRAAGAPKYRSPALNAFEERRLAGKGGQFVSDSAMRLNETRTLPNVLSMMAGLQKVNGMDATYIASMRSGGTGGGLVFQRKGVDPNCYVTLYVDGVMRWQGPATVSNPPLDFSQFTVTDLAGAEFYPGGASLPAQYSSTGTTCGVLLLWTRER
ncbi:MAG: carboxypeptidase regulatory-like domain-containing protein [Gemmatimonadaceae bacterium]